MTPHKSRPVRTTIMKLSLSMIHGQECYQQQGSGVIEPSFG